MKVIKLLWNNTNLWDKFSVFCTLIITLGVVFNFNPMNTDKDFLDWALVSTAFLLCSVNTINDILSKVDDKLSK